MLSEDQFREHLRPLEDAGISYDGRSLRVGEHHLPAVEAWAEIHDGDLGDIRAVVHHESGAAFVVNAGPSASYASRPYRGSEMGSATGRLGSPSEIPSAIEDSVRRMPPTPDEVAHGRESLRYSQKRAGIMRVYDHHSGGNAEGGSSHGYVYDPRSGEFTHAVTYSNRTEYHDDKWRGVF